MIRLAFLAAALAMVVAAPLAAAERIATVTDFDRIRIEGAFVVEVTAARSTTARVSGTPGAVEATQLTVQGRTLVVRRDRQAWSSDARRDTGAPMVRVTLPALQGASISGSASLAVDALRGPRLSLSVEGSGRISVLRVDAERLDTAIVGAGTMKLSGTAKDFGTLVRGAGTLDAGALTVSDAKIVSESSGQVMLAATRSARITAAGSGSVVVTGKPACTVTNTGSGSVTCGLDQPQRR